MDIHFFSVYVCEFEEISPLKPSYIHVFGYNVYILRTLGKKWTTLVTEVLAKVKRLWIKDTVEQIPALGGDGLADLNLSKSKCKTKDGCQAWRGGKELPA